MRQPVLLASAMLCAIGCAAAVSQAQTAMKKAPTPPNTGAPTSVAPHLAADLQPTKGNQASGKLSIVAEKDGVRISGTIQGLQPNSEHGFHVHEKGDCSAPDASSAGGHFNPGAQAHGNPSAAVHHLGDAPSVHADAKGVAAVDVKVNGATLGTGESSDVSGKAVVVHEKADDYTTQPSGNSGGRIACGVIK
jgi:Cu-Zn family superoxide dismutase